MKRTSFVAGALILCASLFLVAGCSRDKSFSVANVRKAQTIVLQSPAANGRQYRIEVNGHGYLDGESNLFLVSDGQQQTKHLKGLVNFNFSGGWSGGVAEIRYAPGGRDNVRSG